MSAAALALTCSSSMASTSSHLLLSCMLISFFSFGDVFWGSVTATTNNLSATDAARCRAESSKWAYNAGSSAASCRSAAFAGCRGQLRRMTPASLQRCAASRAAAESGTRFVLPFLANSTHKVMKPYSKSMSCQRRPSKAFLRMPVARARRMNTAAF